MANQEDDIDLRAENIEELEEREQSLKRANRIVDMIILQCRRKIKDLQKTETYHSAIEALTMNQEDALRCLSHLPEAQEAEEDIEGLRQAVKEVTAGSLVFFYLPEGPTRDQCKDGSKRIWLKATLSPESGEPEEDTTDVVGQLRQKSTEFEGNLYCLLALLDSLAPESKKEAAHYEKFKSCLNRLVKDSKNEIVRGILDLMNVFQWKVGNSGSSKGKVDKGRRIDSLLGQFLKNIQLVTILTGQISSLADCVEECEAEQNDIKSKIKALKEMD